MHARTTFRLIRRPRTEPSGYSLVFPVQTSGLDSAEPKETTSTSGMNALEWLLTVVGVGVVGAAFKMGTPVGYIVGAVSFVVLMAAMNRSELRAYVRRRSASHRQR
jgi:hypothetical protein